MQQGAKTVGLALSKEPEEFGVATARRNFADIVNGLSTAASPPSSPRTDAKWRLSCPRSVGAARGA